MLLYLLIVICLFTVWTVDSRIVPNKVLKYESMYCTLVNWYIIVYHLPALRWMCCGLNCIPTEAQILPSNLVNIVYPDLAPT